MGILKGLRRHGPYFVFNASMLHVACLKPVVKGLCTGVRSPGFVLQLYAVCFLRGAWSRRTRVSVSIQSIGVVLLVGLDHSH